MCGIAGILNIKAQTKELRDKALKMAQKIRHRGPDWSGIYVGGSAILAHERLSIVDPQSGGQPLYSPDRKQVLAVNGEIYNHREIRTRYAGKYDFQTGSDCEVILALYKDKGIHFLEDISGIFAFVLYDEEKDEFLIARDPIGVIPLYIGRDKDGKIYFGSELKALEGFCDEYELFLPGHYYYSKEGQMKRWYARDWTEYETVKDNDAKAGDVKEALEDAVHRQLMSDVPYGVLLSGGLDSSVISAIAKKYAAKRIETDGASDAWWPQLHSFAIGLKGAPDLIKAREVAEYIGTVHHEINYTVQEGLDAIRDVIYFIETYDVTTVRASTPMYLLARVIKSMGIKMVLSGESITAQQAQQAGLVSDVFPSDLTLEYALQLASKMARHSPLALQAAKQALRQSQEVALQAGLAQERQLFTLLAATEDRHEGISAFLQKRTPDFKGR